MTKLLVIGNLGYVGSVLSQKLKENKLRFDALDAGYFRNNLTNNNSFTDIFTVKQINKDIRKIKPSDLKGYETVVFLSAISNDPIGAKFKKITKLINIDGLKKVALLSKKMGVKKFIFASSCSVYGSSHGFLTESSKTNPLTDYAISKLKSEKFLEKISSQTFKVICLRFATACGPSPRMRLDLVLNDFVASAFLNKKIYLYSDGLSLRPLIDVRDMAAAIIWGIKFNSKKNILILNVGKNENNIVINNLAKKIAKTNNSKIVYKNKNKDGRSYNVSFDLFNKLTKNSVCKYTINQTVRDTYKYLYNIKFSNFNYRSDKVFIRLEMFNFLLKEKKINKDFFWN